MKNTIQKRVFLLLTGTLLLACAAAAYGEYWPTKAWRTSSPEKEGLDPAVLDGIDGYVKASLPDTSSVLVVRNGLVVFERYYEGDRDSKRPLNSITKSVISALAGIAFDRRMVRSVEDPISSYLPEQIRGGMHETSKTITVRHLLTQTSGFPGDSGWGSVDPRALRSLLSVPPVRAPGDGFAYNEANANLLSVIITQATGQRASAFGNKNLLEALGIRGARWAEAADYTEGSVGLSLTTRDMAKLGLLYLRKGKWENRQLLSEAWVAASTNPQVEVKDFTLAGTPLGYGYLWWTASLREHPLYFALGTGGQFICVFPDLAIVAVLTGTDCEGAGPPAHRQGLRDPGGHQVAAGREWGQALTPCWWRPAQAGAQRPCRALRTECRAFRLPE